VRDTVGIGLETRVVTQIVAAHRGQPLSLGTLVKRSKCEQRAAKHRLQIPEWALGLLGCRDQIVLAYQRQSAADAIGAAVAGRGAAGIDEWRRMLRIPLVNVAFSSIE
jgi:hypothetical protein